jgi:4-hydroxy-tetrahydrodipicolinate synthase
MTESLQEKLRTVHLVPLTPYDGEGNFNAEVFSRHIGRMAAAGITCYLPAAGTSEFHSLSADEIVEIVRVNREAAGADAVIFAPVGLQVGHAIDVAKRSVDAGADGVMFMPFSHPYQSDTGIRDYYHAVLEAVEVPALVYKKAPLPSNALLLEMAAHPQVMGVKYAYNQMHEFRKVVTADDEGIEWLCGSAERFAPYYMLAGSPGYTTGAGNLCPLLTLAMHTAFRSGEIGEAMRYQQLLLPIEDYRAREGDSYNISMLKHAMTVLGENFGPPRPPQRRLTSAEEREITEMMGPIVEEEARLRGDLSEAGLVDVPV